MTQMYNYSFSVPRASRLKYLKEATRTPNVSGLKILDWGGNNGNVLRDGLASNEILPEDYTCIDVDGKVIEQSAELFPRATWITRPVTHPVYRFHNCDDDLDFTPHLNKYDIVFAHSVYTHDVWEKAVKDLEIMYSLTKPGGKVCFTYIDNEAAQIFRIRREKHYGSSIKPSDIAEIADFSYFINHDTLTQNYDRTKSCDFFIAIYNTKWLEEQIKARWNNYSFYKPDLSKVNNFSTEAWHPSVTIIKEV